jgi:addiction module HigA family antidote
MSKSSITTKEKPYRAVFKRPAGGWDVEYVTAHPGEILREEFLVPLNLTANALAIRLRIAAPRLHAILHEKRAVTPDTAMRLARCFGTSAQFWMNLQASHDLTKARLEGGAAIEAEVEPLPRPDLADAA